MLLHILKKIRNEVPAFSKICTVLQQYKDVDNVETVSTVDVFYYG